MPEARRALTLASGVVALAFLGGCSGGGGGTAGAPESPPAVALSGVVDTTYGNGGRMVVPAIATSGIDVDRAGNVFAAASVITKVDPSGHTVAFDDGALASALQRLLDVDSSGNVYTIFTDAGRDVLAKHDASGKLVTSFGQGGRVDLGSWAPLIVTGVSMITTDAQGNVYVRRYWRPATSARPVTVFLTKLDSNGKPVASFGSSGDGNLTLPSVFDLPTTEPVVDAAGNVFAVQPSETNVQVVKFDSGGMAAVDFMSNPVAVPCSPVLGASKFPRIVTTDAAGNVYVAGTCPFAGETRERVFIVKLGANGNVLASFGTGGVVSDFFVATSGSGAIRATGVNAILPAADGSVYVAASAIGEECGSGVAIVKLGADGRLVDAFGTHGVAMLALASGFAVTMRTDSLGRLYVAGVLPLTCPVPSPPPFTYAVYRLTG